MSEQLPKCPSCGESTNVVGIQGNGYYRCDKCARVFTYRAEDPRQASGYPAAPPPKPAAPDESTHVHTWALMPPKPVAPVSDDTGHPKNDASLVPQPSKY